MERMAILGSQTQTRWCACFHVHGRDRDCYPSRGNDRQLRGDTEDVLVQLRLVERELEIQNSSFRESGRILVPQLVLVPKSHPVERERVGEKDRPVAMEHQAARCHLDERSQDLRIPDRP